MNVIEDYLPGIWCIPYGGGGIIPGGKGMPCIEMGGLPGKDISVSVKKI